MKREHKLKLISFLLSATLWYFIVWGKSVEKKIEIPLHFRDKLNNYVYEVNPSTLTLVLIGTRSQFRTLNLNKIQIDLEANKYPPGIHQIRIPIEKINLPKGIKIKEISPNYVTLIVKKISSKRVPVRVNLIKTRPKERYKIMLKPGVVTLKGYWEDLREIEEVQTEEVDLGELKESKVLEVKIKYPEGVLEVQPNQVKIIYLTH